MLNFIISKIHVEYAIHIYIFTHTWFPAFGQAVVTGVVPSAPPVLAFSLYIAKGSAIPLFVDQDL